MKMLLLILSLFFSNDSLDKQIKNYLDKHFSAYPNYEYEIMSVPKNEKGIVIQSDKEFSINKNMVYIPVKITGKGTSSSSFISVKVKLYKYVLVARQTVNSKTELNASMFRPTLVDVTGLRGTPVENFDELNNLRSNSYLSTGKVLMQEDVENIPLIFNGDEVTAIKNIGSVTISVLAYSREEGSAGEKIKIRTVDNKQFTATIIDKKKVSIEE